MGDPRGRLTGRQGLRARNREGRHLYSRAVEDVNRQAVGTRRTRRRSNPPNSARDSHRSGPDRQCGGPGRIAPPPVQLAALGVEGIVADITGTVFGSDIAPPPGTAPAYSRRTPRLLPNPVDDAVLDSTVDLIVEAGPGSVGSSQLLVRLADLDLTTDLIEEAISSLAEQNLVEVSRSFGGTTISRLRPRVWLGVLRARGTDIDALHEQLLVHFVDHGSSGGFEETDRETVHALTSVLESERLIERATRTLDGTAHANATVAGQRRAREL